MVGRITTRFLAGWLMAALVFSFAIVGCGAITHDDADRTGSSDGPLVELLKPCTLNTGQEGLLYDGLCLPAPPAGWTGPTQ